VIAGPVSQIAEKLAQAKLDGPVLVLLGRAMASALREHSLPAAGVAAGAKSIQA